jgi:hypothetical protein
MAWLMGQHVYQPPAPSNEPGNQPNPTQPNPTQDPRGDEFELGRGTTVSLHLKDESKDLLKESTLKELVAKYSQFINFPIYLYTTKEVEVGQHAGGFRLLREGKFAFGTRVYDQVLIVGLLI